MFVQRSVGAQGKLIFPADVFWDTDAGTGYYVLGAMPQKAFAKTSLSCFVEKNSEKLRFRFKIPIIIVLMRLTCSRAQALSLGCWFPDCLSVCAQSLVAFRMYRKPR